jgi:DNA-binding transcriptional regulator YiaG
MPDLLADLDALQESVRARDAVQSAEFVAHSAQVVRDTIAALGISQGGLARELGVGEKTARDWCAARALPGPPAVRAMRLLVERIIGPPPIDLAAGSDREAGCLAAMHPQLESLASRAETAGWTAEEVRGALSQWIAARRSEQS